MAAWFTHLTNHLPHPRKLTWILDTQNDGLEEVTPLNYGLFLGIYVKFLGCKWWPLPPSVRNCNHDEAAPKAPKGEDIFNFWR